MNLYILDFLNTFMFVNFYFRDQPGSQTHIFFAGMRIPNRFTIYIWNPFVLCFVSKRRSFPIKTRDIWVPGIYVYINIFICFSSYLYIGCFMFVAFCRTDPETIGSPPGKLWKVGRTQQTCQSSWRHSEVMFSCSYSLDIAQRIVCQECAGSST